MKKVTVRSRPLQFVLDVVHVFTVHNVPRTAAQMSYYLLFSLFPLLMIVIGIVSVLRLDVDAVLGVLSRLPMITDLVEEYVAYVLTNESPALMWAGLVMAITASSAAFRGLMNISGEISGQPTFHGLVKFGVSFIMSVVLLLIIFFLMVATVTGRWFLDLVSEHIQLGAVVLAWQWLRFPVVFALAVMGLCALYRVSLPKQSLPHGRAWPGAVVASVGLVIGTAVFSVFISMTSRYSLIYGSLASIIILLLWFFVCSNILVLGNVINCVLAWGQREEEPTITFSVK